MNAAEKRNIEEVEHIQKHILLAAQEPFICVHFGCGRALSSQEQLFGKYCVAHSKPEKVDVTMVMKFK